MKNLKLYLYKNHEEKPEKIVTIPLSALHVADQFLPKSVKSVLAKEGISLTQCKDLGKEKDLVLWGINSVTYFKLPFLGCH